MSESSDAYMTGWRAGYHNATLAERKRIITALRDAETAKTLMVLARNTANENPKDIQNHAWHRIETVLREEQK
jgi:hypothetical protein